jgi:hypothetical protein
MSGGYVPLFESLTTGTLCGRWPDVGLWPIILSLSDRFGAVDVTVAYLARVTGLAEEDVTACMQRFCKPDPYSRSSEKGGARLILIDSERRNWGWRVVNHGKYAERARKRAYDERRQESGQNAERLKAARGSSRRDPTQSDATRDDPLSSHLNSTNKDSRPLARTVPESFHQEVIEAYHELLSDHPHIKAWPKRRSQALNARIAERLADGKAASEITYWRGFFETVAASDFLSGKTTGFRPSLEWLLKPENFLKVIEGNYANRTNGAHAHG